MGDINADIEAIKKAFKGAGTDEAALIKIFGHRSKEYLIELAAQYPQKYNNSLESDIKSETSGRFRDILVGLQKNAIAVSLDLLRSATKGAGTREKAIIDVLLTLNNDGITKVRQEDPKIIADILGDVSGDFKKVINELLKGVREEGNHVDDAEAQTAAEKLYKAGEGKLGTDEDAFIEIIAKKSPAFLQRVSHFYQAKHKNSLQTAIEKETSGNFERILVGLTKPRLVYIADRFHNAIAGLGTDDVALVYFFSVLNKQELQQVARLYQERHKNTLVADVKGDTSGDYRDLCVALLS
eukprot:TRINITY_DN594_c0_g1_i1.p1 TRINITY_DN594_c0_g1~~TRINITY_DN594_c0_g1_i1.p1  ORF type:complete len:297 (+),score=84.07 TRINITY_DN594_c0_g1_i1:105-995(+)